jgi:hypothetical protein
MSKKTVNASGLDKLFSESEQEHRMAHRAPKTPNAHDAHKAPSAPKARNPHTIHKTPNAHDTHSAPNALNAHDTHKSQAIYTVRKAAEQAGGYSRINLKVPSELKEHLENAAWENHQNVTQYINNLIEADKAKAKNQSRGGKQ